MKMLCFTTVIAATLTLAACTEQADKTVDDFIDRKDLSQLEAGIWIDPNGCDHWIIDDGIEGYLSARLDRAGRPVCSGIAPPNTATGAFQDSSVIPDLF